MIIRYLVKKCLFPNSSLIVIYFKLAGNTIFFDDDSWTTLKTFCMKYIYYFYFI